MKSDTNSMNCKQVEDVNYERNQKILTVCGGISAIIGTIGFILMGVSLL